MRKFCLLFLFFSIYTSLYAQDFITRWNLGYINAMHPAISNLPFEILATGPVYYTWQTVPAGLSGSGFMNGPNVIIGGLPAGSIIKLSMDTTNLRGVKFLSSCNRILDVEQWGDVHWFTMEEAFISCMQLSISATDTPDLSNAVSTKYMFSDCFNIVGIPNINNWNTSNLTDMSFMFYGSMPLMLFNDSIGNWNTANVTNMTAMFCNAVAFNSPIGNWNTANVTDMSAMFLGAGSFNQPIGNWNTANVTNMANMFSASSFNKVIGNWNTANVTNMARMFRYNSQFNQSLTSWNTANVTDMSWMFDNASSFNQPNGNWQLNQNVNLFQMFNGSGMDCINYSATLYGWNNNLFCPVNRNLGFNNMKYLLYAESARNNLINQKGWTIVGDTLYNNCCTMLVDTIYETACNLVVFNGQPIFNSGIYYDTLVNIGGCDSLITLFLTVNYTTSFLSDTTCNFFFFNGQTLTNSGTYYDTLTNMNGCDSLIILNLTINQADTITINQTSCNSFFFNGQNLTNSGTYYDTLVNQFGCDSLITLNLIISQPDTQTINQSACNSFFFNGQNLTNSGTYYDTLVNMNGCDSLITLNLTINQANTSVTQNGSLMTANAIGATYQWLSCNPYQEIIGETNQSYTATANGDYAVIVTENGCTDTSACYTVNNVGFNQPELSNAIKIYPNPVSHLLQIENASAFKQVKIKVMSITGLLLATYDDISADKFLIDIASYASGNYLIQIENEGQRFVRKIYKE